MIVRELIEKLKEYDEDLRVLVYVEVGEDMDEAHGVCIQDVAKPEEFLYCKGDHPLGPDPRWRWIKDADKAVCIR